jgi:hypothetical protein
MLNSETGFSLPRIEIISNVGTCLQKMIFTKAFLYFFIRYLVIYAPQAMDPNFCRSMKLFDDMRSVGPGTDFCDVSTLKNDS